MQGRCDLVERMAKNRLIVASVRLPVTMTRGEQGWQVAHSTGGLVTALSSVLERRIHLAGAHAYVDEADRPQ